ncbi:MAG: peptidase in kexin sedolisin [Microbacteriaceae bacterium]|nr:peptidase in kexin sedolisin [Microbacteriaceae bacterium]
MDALDLVRLRPVMAATGGDPSVLVAVVDGPVARHDKFAAHMAGAPLLALGDRAAAHGTFVAGVLGAARASGAPGICPDCTLLIAPVLSSGEVDGNTDLRADVAALTAAIVSCTERGAVVVNLSVALSRPSTRPEPELDRALDYAASRGCLVVAAAGNQGVLGSSALTRHPWVIPVAALAGDGRPVARTNLGASIGRRGLGAPGDAITSLGYDGGYQDGGGTSAGVPFVTGALALLRCLFPSVSAAALRWTVLQAARTRPYSVIPPLLDAAAAYNSLAALLPSKVDRREKVHV